MDEREYKILVTLKGGQREVRKVYHAMVAALDDIHDDISSEMYEGVSIQWGRAV